MAVPRSAGLDARPEAVEGDAVVERGAVDDLAIGELHDPGVAVLVELAVVGDPAAVPDNGDGVVVGVDAADRDRTEWLTRRESGAERGQDLVDELLLAAVLLGRD